MTWEVVDKYLWNSFKNGDVSLATNHSILVLIQVTILIRELLSFQCCSANGKNFVASVALAGICTVRILLFKFNVLQLIWFFIFPVHNGKDLVQQDVGVDDCW